jgi:hypothetical protein
MKPIAVFAIVANRDGAWRLAAVPAIHAVDLKRAHGPCADGVRGSTDDA